MSPEKMNTIDPPVRIGVIGFGDFGRRYAATLDRLFESALARFIENPVLSKNSSDVKRQ